MFAQSMGCLYALTTRLKNCAVVTRAAFVGNEGWE